MAFADLEADTKRTIILLLLLQALHNPHVYLLCGDSPSFQKDPSAVFIRGDVNGKFEIGAYSMKDARSRYSALGTVIQPR